MPRWIRSVPSASYLGSVYLLQRLKILQYDLNRKRRLPKLDNLHRSAMMCGPRARRLYALSKIVFYTVEDDGGVVYCVYLRAEELHRHTACQTLGLSAIYDSTTACLSIVAICSPGAPRRLFVALHLLIVTGISAISHLLWKGHTRTVVRPSCRRRKLPGCFSLVIYNYNALLVHEGV
jgi:hypothetical protein